MTERQQLEEAIASLEGKRGILGDLVVDKALAPLRERLAILDAEVKAITQSTKPSITVAAGERRIVTILFCDVKGSTAMAEQFDPEEWAGIIRGGLDYMIEPIRRRNATLAEVRGDGILAFFGAPVAHEDDPHRAILAGLEILEGIQNYREHLQRTRGLDFHVRVGIHTGLVVVGEVGNQEQVEYTAIGDAVNLAARMEQTAQPDTIQISAETYRHVDQTFACQPLGEIKVKGKRQPVRTYQVTGLKAEPGPLRGLKRQGLQSPLVGREIEFAILKNSLERLLDGQGGILSIVGEAGIGKSRLIAELFREAPVGNLYWLEGHSLSYGQTIPFWPFQEILRCFADITNADGEERAWRKLEEKITSLFPENPADILPYLASLLVLPVRGDYIGRVKYLDGETLGKQIFLATRRFFERLATTRPVVLIFEDLHWMDESSVSLLEHLLPLVESVPLLIFDLSRPDPRAHVAGLRETILNEHARCYTEVRLAPLSPAASDQLVQNLLEIEDLPTRVRAMIVSKADGNPFFLEEVLRELIDLGAIQHDPTSGHWRAVAQIERFTIPDTVQGVILARVDRLDEGLKQVLRVAAVIGRSFLYQVLEAVDETWEALDERLGELQRLGFIQEKQPQPELEYMFKHALAQEAVYESMLLQKRRELHGKVGQVIERLFAGRLEEFYSLLAHHYAAAEAWEPAQTYLLKAADQAGRMAADPEALAHYQRAKEAYRQAFGEQWDPVEQAALERKMGEAFYRRGEMSEALVYLRKSLTLLESPLPKPRWPTRSAIVGEILQQASRSLLPGLYPNRDATKAAEEELRVYQTLVSILPGGDPELFLLVMVRMLNTSEQNRLPAGIAIGSAGLGIVFGFLNLHRFSEHYNLQAVRLADQHQRLDALGMAYMGRMQSSFFRSERIEWEKVSEYGQRAAQAFREIGNLGTYSVAVANAAILSLWRGDFAFILAKGRELTQLGRDAADRLIQGNGLWLQGVAETRLRQPGEAITHLGQASEIAEIVGNIYLTALAGNELGEWHLHQGDWRSALQVLDANNRFLITHNMRRDANLTSVLQNKLAWTYLMAVEHSDLAGKAAWLKKAKGACRNALKKGKSYRTAKPEAMRWQGRYEWLKGNPLEARRWWQKSLAEAETLEMPYELALTYQEMGLRLDDPAKLENAKAIFTGLGIESN